MTVLFRRAAGKVSCRRALVCVGAVLLLAAGICTRAQQKDDAASRVSVTGYLSRVPVRNGQTVRFWITIENGTSSALERIRLELIDPGQFERVPGSMSVPAGKICQTPSSKLPKGGALAAPPPDEKEICAYLGPHETYTVWGDLQANDSVERQSAFAVIEWQSPDGPSVAAASLGEIESLNWARWLWYSLLHEWELGVPTFTAVIGGIIALWKWRRDKKEARLHEKREEESRKQRELEDNRSKTWNLMLRDSHRVALKYYLPVGSGLYSTKKEIGRFRATGGTDVGVAQSAFFYLLRFHWDLRRTMRDLGGYYFKNRTAESLVNFLFQEHRELLQLTNPATQRLLDRCLDLMSATVTSDDIAGMIGAPQPDIVAFWNHAHPWFSTAECDRDLPVLEGYLGILIFEANRPYLHWYGTLEPLALSPPVRGVVTWVGWSNKMGKATDEYLEAASAAIQA